MLHFGRRGRENLSSLKRKHFAVKRGADDKLYVYKVIDEQTKNHQSDSELSSDGRMYEITSNCYLYIHVYIDLQCNYPINVFCINLIYT